MRSALIPQTADGHRRSTTLLRFAARARAVLLRASLVAVALLAVLPSASLPAAAQDPSKATKAGEKSVFGKPKDGMFGKTQKLDTTLPLYLQGDQLIYDTKGSRVVAKGNVEIFYDDNILRADEVIYDQGAGTLTAVGNVELKEKNGNIVHAERYTLTDDFRDGFVQSLSVVAKDDTRIVAERGERRDGNVSEFSGARFTPCKSTNGMPPLWCISARKIIHDKAAQTISYQDASFDVFGQPIIYLPYFEHPDPTVKRKSGFLAPELGNSGDLGFISEVPYYFALAPNYDFLFHPMYLSKQGVLWQGDWRHRLEDGQYWVKLAGIDQNGDDLPDSVSKADRDARDGWRGSLATKGEFSLSSWWKYGWDVTLESDDNFRRFYKLDSILLTDRVNRAYLEGQGDRSYFGASLYHFGGLLLNDSPVSESWVHPIIDYNYVFKDPVLGGELRWDSNVMSFSRAELSDVIPDARDREDINRAVTEVKWRRRFTDALGITYTPFGELRGDIYQLSNFENPETCVAGSTLGCDIEGSETVTRGRASGGVTVSYPWVAYTPSASHVIEPIGQVVTRTASVDQRTLPNEDAKSLIFDDTNLFETDKFSGFDRLETGTRINAGIQYTFQAASGGSLRVLAGQSYHVKGENAYRDPGVDTDGNFVFSPVSGLETDRSDYVLGGYLAPNEYVRVIAQSRFNESDLALRREDVSFMVNYGPVWGLGTYTYAAYDPQEYQEDLDAAGQEISGSLGLRLTDTWSVLGSLRYDIENEQRLMDAIQVRYLDECFMLSVTYQETYLRNQDVEPDQTVMLRFELKHLGGYKYKTDVLDHVFGSDQPQ